MIKQLRAPIKVKTGLDNGLEEGQFEAYASTFVQKPDSYGDIVNPGAFEKTLQEWGSSGKTLPVMYSHRFDDPDYNLGGVVKAYTDEHGLRVVGQLDLDNPKAAQVYRLLKGGRIGQMSFSYAVNDQRQTTLADGQKVNELMDVSLYEVSVVPVGANQTTEILAVKAAVDAVAQDHRGLKDYHLDHLRQAQEAISKVLADAEPEEKDAQETKSDVEEGLADQGDQPKSTPDTFETSVETWAAVINLQAAQVGL